jgi:SAM-dependent methyltransferase
VTRSKRSPGAGAKPGRTRTIEVDRGDSRRVAEYKQGAVDYARNLPDWARQELYRKPFVTFTEHVEPVALVYLRDLANLLELLDLPAGASVLDVACGPGWLSEAFYRFGYRVTGVDIADALLEIARERIARLASPPIERDTSWIEFHVLDIEAERLERRFDAVLLYDCLHHFVDAAAALGNIRAMLGTQGTLIVKEGAMPAPGSEGERELIAESETYTTLEAPFDPDALERLLGDAGFAHVRRYESAPPLVPARQSLAVKLRRAWAAPPGPPVNFFVCRPSAPPRPDGTASPRPWAARIERLSARPGSDGLHLRLRLTNVGGMVWTAGTEDRTGTVCVGFRRFDPEGRLLDELAARTPVPRDLAPGESLETEILYPWPEGGAAGARLAADLVCQGRFWFSDHGSPALDLELPARV